MQNMNDHYVNKLPMRSVQAKSSPTKSVAENNYTRT
jgi:hypothetical protein